MPVPLWTGSSKAEAKYNVVTEFPQLGLHAAAASGNVGLVEYALEHGQPINSVLDGVLPIHAASAGGHVQVVKKLIEHGADVNAPRLSRRYFNDKHRDASAPIVGTSGSTPLHFAAANGNTDVVTLLLLHGAHPDRADKYGVTPEALARENNWLECAQILHDWVLNKDRDLREREALSSRDGNGAASVAGQTSRMTTPPEPESPSFRRRLHMKHSIDTALNMLKSSTQPDSQLRPDPHAAATASPPPSPFGQYSFDPDANGSHHVDSDLRRPSLPQIPPPRPGDERKKATTSNKLRRPQSAGTGAERSPEQELIHPPFGRGGSGRKLGNKISLLGLFKKSDGECPSPAHSNPSTPARPSTSTASAVSPLQAATRGTENPTSPSPQPPEVTDRSSRKHASSDVSNKGSKVAPQSKLHPRSSTSFLEFDSAPPSPLPQPPMPSAVDLHNALAQRSQPRERSTTISTFSEFDSDSEEEIHPLSKPPIRIEEPPARHRSSSSTKSPPLSSDSKTSLLPVAEGPERPPSILKHHRTPSSDPSSASPARALRFNSASTPDRIRKDPSSNGSTSSNLPPLKTTSSSHSLNPSAKDSSPSRPPPSDQQPAETIVDNSTHQTEPPSQSSINHDDVVEPPIEDPSRSRRKSFGSASRSSLSPLFTDENATIQTLSALKNDFPFSINQPPPLEDDKAHPADKQLQIPDMDRRHRGDSVSSTWTADSSNVPQYSASGSTIGSSSSPVLSTPSGDNSLHLPYSSNKTVDEDDRYDSLVRLEEGSKDSVSHVHIQNGRSTLNERRAHSPLDIDISGISTHAQAKALVEKTRQDILELANTSAPSNSSATPLSAKLAAYGESLALQRKLKEKEHAKMIAQLTPPTSPTRRQQESSVTAPPVVEIRRGGVERQMSLDKPGRMKPRPKAKDPRRPSTADGLSTRPVHNSFFPGEHIRTHHISQSLSPPGLANTSASYDGRDFLSPHHRFPTSASLITVPEPSSAPALARGPPPPPSTDDEIGPYTRTRSPDSVDTDMEMSPTPIRQTASTSAIGNTRNTVRNATSTKKLNRMGFTVVDQVSRPPQPPSGKIRLTGFKSIMQTLKGKS